MNFSCLMPDVDLFIIPLAPREGLRFGATHQKAFAEGRRRKTLSV